ncbi:MAG: sugar phosphate isomerase/epimerase [Lentisphaeria bacterium]|nr:sugar phosphate isomerase/epimerase [Lentisphaeria bacterium]
MAKPIALQLYTLREAAKTDFAGLLRKVAALGYKGVEPAGFHDLTPAEFRRVVEDLGMTVCSSHGPWAKPDNLNEVVDTAAILGIDLVGTGFGPQDFAAVDRIRRTAESVAAMAETLHRAGLTLFIHNHYWEFAQVEGRLAYDWFLESCGPHLTFEIDAYWTSNHGANDPAAMVAKFADRLPLLHIKDGPLERDKAMSALGTGKMDIPAVLRACNENVLRWVIVELDRCDTDMFQAVADSYTYMTANGFALGNR